MGVSVNIKMYRVGELGDCFLLRFTNGQEKTHVLIDCGSYWNSKESKQRLNDIAKDIKKKVTGAKLDIIVGTHQHNDHLSGFVHAEPVFKSMQPGQVWLSWLDDPTDARARKIGKDYNNYLTSLRLINKELGRKFFADASGIKSTLEGLLGFHGIHGIEKGLNVKTNKVPAELPATARKNLQNMGEKKPRYLSPGEVFDLPGISNSAVKVYVLGPPREDEFLYKKEPRKDETFDHKLSLNAVNVSKLLGSVTKITSTTDEDPFPFDEPYEKSKNFKYVEGAYKSDPNRQIELDWLNQATQLALWLDGFTNNSSLVLAFEIVKTKKVLLFAADAQAGNWRSWNKVKWKKMPKEFNWLTLMKNTVLYKTGHHGSHNSTLKEGLDNMNHKELVVMIPVDESDPMVNYGKGWQMPATNLYKELKKRSQNRIIRMDKGISTGEAWKDLPKKPSKYDLYWEYEVHE